MGICVCLGLICWFYTEDKDSDYSSKDMEEVQRLLSSAVRDCVPGERNSFVAFQANTGVEVFHSVVFIVSIIRIFTIDAQTLFSLEQLLSKFDRTNEL